ncbi:HD domain-containing protein [Saliphagus infecundisoli]|uniref:HD domain-containing protein n=1 Tax=Saliphagus infecundisoli TaxID=1849069 RepID=A0ABD5QL46_9EURY|nr:HD domain-containing protein [Saliphagus infecundisoli]
MSSEADGLRETARSYFAEYDPGPAHDWHHVERVEALADRLAAGQEADGRKIDERVLHAAVLLHDIGRGREEAGEIEDHAAWGASEARDVLGEREGFDAERTEAVAHAIRAHRYSNDVEPETVEARLLSDADNLDALGAIGIARVFAYGGETGTPIHDPDRPVEADDSPAGETGTNHLRKKILALPERMYTDRGRDVAEQRRAFVEDFLERLEAEATGDR